MTRYGLISDIHAEAALLSRALKILPQYKIDTIYHLGDIVGGGDKPRLTIELLIKNKILGVSGNHDFTELHFPTKPLSSSTHNYLAALPEKIEEKDMIFVHDNPLAVAFGKGYWLHGSYIRNTEDAKRVFEGTAQRLIMVGHTQVAAAFSNDGEEYFFRNNTTIKLDPLKRYILNPGSVGRPRDSYKSSLGILDTHINTFEVVRF